MRLQERTASTLFQRTTEMTVTTSTTTTTTKVTNLRRPLSIFGMPKLSNTSLFSFEGKCVIRSKTYTYVDKGQLYLANGSS